jgi:4-methyl-5(b-hydroxyethyl)-thiazole monophosphate biosynthesis
MTTALVPVANGTEEMEAVIIIDVLRRAKWDVTVAGIGGTNITASRKVKLAADVEWSKINPASFDVMAIPGGAEGARNMMASQSLLDAVRKHAGAGRLTAAVCAGPLVLQAAGVLDGRKATCHPGVRAELTRALAQNDRVVVDGRIVTSQGAGTCFEFALTLVRLVDGKEAADAIAKAIVL